MSRTEADTAMRLALGRLFRLGARPERPGDVEQYENCRRVVMEAAEVLGHQPQPQPNAAPLPGWNFGSGNSGAIE